MKFTYGTICGVKLHSLAPQQDARGWLTELFRVDEIDAGQLPVMAYASWTVPGAARGPHEHRKQTDRFVFIGPGQFLLHIWDNREDSPSYRHRWSFNFGSESSWAIVIPPGVVHGYKNVGTIPGLVLNLPNQLYKGQYKGEEVDEIRHEADPNSPFQM